MGTGLLMKREAPPAIYLAGCISDWRDRVRERWADMDVVLLDPFIDSDQRTLAAFTLDDLALIERSRCVLAYHDYHVFDGLAVEVGYAAALDRMVVYVCKQPRVSSMIAALSKAVFTELDPAMDFIERKLGLKQRPGARVERVMRVGHPPQTEELDEDAMTGQVTEGCCHGVGVKHSHDYVVGGSGEMKCCHGHSPGQPSTGQPRPTG